MFPIDLLCCLIKTNQDGIAHLDSIRHSGEFSHLIRMVASPSPLPVGGGEVLSYICVAQLKKEIQASGQYPMLFYVSLSTYPLRELILIPCNKKLSSRCS